VDVVFRKVTELSAGGLTLVMAEQKASRVLAVAQHG
jgi:hypothetical protein